MTVGLPQYGHEVAAVVSSQISCAPQDGQLYTRILVRICAPVLICGGLPFAGVAPRLRLRSGLLFLFGVQLFDLCRVK